MKIDHHLHTAKHSTDSTITDAELVAAARAAGLDGVVITDHDHQWDEYELAEIRLLAPELLILSGVEVSTKQGHFLTYGLPYYQGGRPDLDLRDLIAVADEYGAAVVVAHPFRFDRNFGVDFRQIMAEFGPAFAAIEVASNNITPAVQRQIAEFVMPLDARGAAVRQTASSDAHVAKFVGSRYTLFDAEISSMAEFVAALKSGCFSPRY